IESRRAISKHVDGKNSAITTDAGIAENSVQRVRVAIQKALFARIYGNQSSRPVGKNELVCQMRAEDVSFICGNQIGLVIDVRDEQGENSATVVVRAMVFRKCNVDVVFRRDCEIVAAVKMVGSEALHRTKLVIVGRTGGGCDVGVGIEGKNFGRDWVQQRRAVRLGG